MAGLLIAAALYFGTPAFFAWKHVISSSGGHYFLHRVVIPVPVFTQNDPRWTFELLGPTFDTMGQAGCAVTSAAMVLSAYGVDTDPERLNQYLTTHGGYTDNGWIYWEKAAEVAPGGQVEKAYEGLPSYALIDENLMAGNPMIVRLTLRDGTTHFVVLVGKDGWDYLVRDPARDASRGVYPLKELTGGIEALRFYRVVAAH
jgi:ABC-type bacteriocin/lantibiotic exporter with double-glycine peptidase domain